MKSELNMLLGFYYENTKKYNVNNFLGDGPFKISHMKEVMTSILIV